MFHGAKRYVVIVRTNGFFFSNCRLSVSADISHLRNYPPRKFAGSRELCHVFIVFIVEISLDHGHCTQ